MDQTLRSDKATYLIVSHAVSQFVVVCFTLKSHCFDMVPRVETQHFPVALFGSISNQLAATGSTTHPNCSLSMLCLFSHCQNTRMCNQGWALNEARQSHYCAGDRLMPPRFVTPI